MLYGDWIGRWGESFPDCEALVDIPRNRRYTYGELRDYIHRLANLLLSEFHIRKGDRIAVLATSRGEYITLFFAAARIGAIFVPLNVRLTREELLYYLQDSSPKAIFYDQENRPTAEWLIAQTGIDRSLCFDAIAAQWAGLSSARPPETALAADDPQMILYTSGTTGLPKGAILTCGAIAWNAINTIVGWGLRRGDRTILHSALFYTAGWNVLTLPLFHNLGANILIGRFDPDLILDLIAREKISVFFAVPTMFQMMIDSPRFEAADLSSVRLMLSGGAPLPENIFEIFEKKKGVQIRQGYGLTEAGPNNFMADGRFGTVGRPMLYVDIRVVDDAGAEVTPGQEGELLLKGPHVCSGYWNKPLETAAAIRDGWFYTSDLARVDQDGCVSIAGRKKDMFISGGINIYPAEIERVIAAHPKIAAVAVIGVPDRKWGEAGKAIVELKPGERLTLAELQAFLSDRMARFKIPKYMTVVDELPRTAGAAKVQKFILRERHGKADNE